MWCGRLGIDSENDPRAVKYKADLLRLSQRYAEFVFVPMVAEIPFVEEPNRADLASRAPVEESIKTFIIENNLPFKPMRFTSPRWRATEITLIMESVEQRWL